MMRGPTRLRRYGFEACADLFPSRAPLDPTAFEARWKPRALCSNSLAVLHSGLTKTPLVVVERLNAAQMRDARGEERTDEFFADPRLPRGERAELEDFACSGWDRGHLSPAAPPRIQSRDRRSPRQYEWFAGRWLSIGAIEDASLMYWWAGGGFAKNHEALQAR